MYVVGDRSQPLPARGEAAESLGILGNLRAIPALIRVLKDPERDMIHPGIP